MQSAAPFPAMSNAVPWLGEVLIIGIPIVTFTALLNARSFSEWSLDKKEWEVKQGSYNIHIGASSKDIRLSNQINL